MGFFPDINLTASRLFANLNDGTNIDTNSPLNASANNHVVATTATDASNINSAATTSSPMMPLTPEAVRQAAIALNIPWSKALEEAVLAQSLLASLPMTLPIMTTPLRQSTTPSQPTTPPQSNATVTSIANMVPKQGASINVAHDSTMDISPPCTPVMSTISSLSPLYTQPMGSPSSSSLASPLSPTMTMATTSPKSSAPSTPRLSILSSTQTRLPIGNSNTTIQATTYKSTYRTASLFKRNRELEQPPSVLDGKDLSELDEVALKRAKNTDAARRSRHKKLVRMESLEQRVAELEVENSMFESKLNEVELERSLLADKDQMQQARIQELEQMLASMREKQY
ncbi:hypothetical protein BCR41DRAFT_66133 [Lobosporangium transversale]|uniref:BZIP domain-containing protein n=1 Tax=Lobosporangium transversale TaxID=64571 RepID=A0A1Y2GP81_9FUNG|nr:hypothetical protein BCR41DRAFT_66133 [Lobosporangium transversale]ORZ15581.1 hypothetical protein BCR41DRAFT_66133 [Lobosporangium transversale]|eukprot:XP_021881329.1 hypothetical protein BCR41DRAFT_66133 [Lobosporangium transversale]